MKCLWVRHGETEMNRQARYLGHTDVGLHENGRKQIAALAEQLQSLELNPAKIYASDLQRCVQTAELLTARFPCSVQTTAALRELSFGEWELLTYDEIVQKNEEEVKKWHKDPLLVSPPGGESLQQLGERVDSWLQEIVEMHAGEEALVIVTHGGVIRWFQSAWLTQDKSHYWQVEGLRHGTAMLTEWDGQRWTYQPLL
ncbi:MAG TPA: alpha-ribazole phosphatase [Brevibacillus sp.]|nr:alpha-ribazole phosphatase [Brevibacillus sp.]